MTDTNQTRTVQDTIDSLSSFTRSVFCWLLRTGWTSLSSQSSSVTAHDIAAALACEVIAVNAAIGNLQHAGLLYGDDCTVDGRTNHFIYCSYDEHHPEHAELRRYRDELMAEQDAITEPELADEPYRGPNTKLVKPTAAQREALYNVAAHQDGSGENLLGTLLHGKTLNALLAKDFVEYTHDGLRVRLTSSGRCIVNAANWNEPDTTAAPSVNTVTPDQIKNILDDLITAKMVAYDAVGRTDKAIREAHRAKTEAMAAYTKIEAAIAGLKSLL